MSDLIKNLLQQAHENSRSDIEDMLEPVGGSRIVTTLSDSEAADYVLIANREIELLTLRDHLVKRLLSRTVDGVVSSDELFEVEVQQLAFESKHKFFDNESEALHFLEKVTTFEALNTAFWFGIRQRTKNFGEFLAVRSGWRVVAIGKKYK